MEPPVPLAQRLSNPPLATRIGNPPLRDRMGPLPPSNSVSPKRAHKELSDGSPLPETPVPKKKKTRALHSGKGEETKPRAKARRVAQEAEEDPTMAAYSNPQAVLSSLNVRLEDWRTVRLRTLGSGRSRTRTNCCSKICVCCCVGGSVMG
jgi:hypothetical protein